MRKITHIVQHCTATETDAKISSIQRHWKETLGWKNPGYHFIIEYNGAITQLQPIELPSNGVGGHNANAIHISTIGGKEVDDRSPAQKLAQEGLIKALHAVYPSAEILGHRDFPNVAKSCPRYDAKTFVKEIKV